MKLCGVGNKKCEVWSLLCLFVSSLFVVMIIARMEGLVYINPFIVLLGLPITLIVWFFGSWSIHYYIDKDM